MGRTAPSPSDPSQPRGAAHPLPHRISTTPRPRSSTGLGQRKGSADPQSGAPPHHRSHAGSLSPSELSPAAAHDRDDPSTDDHSNLPGRTGSSGLCCVATGPGGSQEVLPASSADQHDPQYGQHVVLLRTMIDRIDPCAAGKPTAIRTSRTRPTITVRIVALAIARPTAGPRTKAVVPRRGRARLDLGDRGSARFGGRCRSSPPWERH